MHALVRATYGFLVITDIPAAGIAGVRAIGQCRPGHARTGCLESGITGTASTFGSTAAGDKTISTISGAEEAGGPALQRFVARSSGTALEVIDEFSVRPEAVPGALAPEGAFVGRLNGRVPFRIDEETLPAQLLTTVDTDFC